MKQNYINSPFDKPDKLSKAVICFRVKGKREISNVKPDWFSLIKRIFEKSTIQEKYIVPEKKKIFYILSSQVKIYTTFFSCN